MSDTNINFTINNNDNMRIDLFLVERLETVSRSEIQKQIKAHKILVNNNVVSCKYVLLDGDVVEGKLEDKVVIDKAQKVEFEIVFEDEHLIIINKPVNLVIHPGAGNREFTLLNGLLDHHEQAKTMPRAGIVHRLDKNTSGLMVVAKNETTQNLLIELIKNKDILRQYCAIVKGAIPFAIVQINQPIGRHNNQRTKMAVTEQGKEAISNILWRTNHKSYSEVGIGLQTGRTHQIRVHLSHLGYPIIGDEVYGNSHPLMKRQALHSNKLSFVHPITKENLSFTKEPPEDYMELKNAIWNN